MNNQSINWQDPLYLLDKLTEEEKDSEKEELATYFVNNINTSEVKN